MFNFSDFCKENNCPNYKEQDSQVGLWKYCELVGPSFYVMVRPEHCPHADELDALAKYEKEKHEAWKKLSSLTNEPKKENFLAAHNKKYGFYDITK